jgi:hypothetical protein
MLDWQMLVRHHLALLDLPPDEREEVIAELAAHLEEQSGQLRLQGNSAEESASLVLRHISDWDAFAKEIYAARKGDAMNTRTRTLWLPGLVTLTLSMGFLLFLQSAGFPPRTAQWQSHGYVLLFYVPWLLSLPLFGALGAYLSARAGGSRPTVVLASIFPAFFLVISFFVILPLAVFFDRSVTVHFHLLPLIPALFVAIILPSAALFLGGRSLLALRRPRSTQS